MVNLSTKELIQQYVRGADVLSRALLTVIDTIQPTSVLAERAISRVCKARRACRRGLKDRRFTNLSFFFHLKRFLLED